MIIKDLNSDEDIINYDWDKAALGFSNNTVVKLPIDSINIKYRCDADSIDGVDLNKYFDYASELPPIEVSFERGKFWLEDGHHRIEYARQLGCDEIAADVTIKDNPFDYVGMQLEDILKLKQQMEDEKIAFINSLTRYAAGGIDIPPDYVDAWDSALQQQKQQQQPPKQPAPAPQEIPSINPEDEQAKNDPEAFHFQPVTIDVKDVPAENRNDFPSLEDTYSNTIPANYETAIMQFYPMVDDANIFDTKYDVSFNTLYYLGLGGLGGKYVTWMLGREFMDEHEKKRRDMEKCRCDDNHGNTFLIEDLLNNAMTAGFRGYPAIFTQAGHVACNCCLVFNKSQNFTSADDIPDSCPSVPVTNDVKAKQRRKQEIYNAIPEVLYINSMTHPPFYITGGKEAAVKSRSVYADEQIQMNRPVRIKKNCIAILPFGMWMPVLEGSNAIILKAEGAFAEIYHIDYSCKLRVRRDVIAIIDNLKESGKELGKDVYFVMADGQFGALVNKKEGKHFVYLPEIDDVKEASEIIALE